LNINQGAFVMEQNQLTPFCFGDNLVRVLEDEDGNPCFVAKDVALALGYEWNGKARIAHVPEEWRGVTSVVTPSGMQEMLTLSEQGLYFFLGRSDKPKALPFQKWLAGEVLPTIRKAGRYEMPGVSRAPSGPQCFDPKTIRYLQEFSGPRIALTESVLRLAELTGIRDRQTATTLFDVYAAAFFDKKKRLLKAGTARSRGKSCLERH
ncbi:MAG: hypothetical protein K2O70_05000, partial [Desulfovibrionaceae bacterium]|nr:hypothetical protein [Desulfovibrionaceae bacterium]